MSSQNFQKLEKVRGKILEETLKNYCLPNAFL